MTTPDLLAPLLRRWHDYRYGALVDDVVEAAIVTLLLVPQSLAYAMLAGLPPVVRVPNDFPGLQVTRSELQAGS